MMIRLDDSIGLSALRIGTSAHETTRSGSAPGGAGTLDGDFLSGAIGIGSDVDPSARGSSVSQHAANVLWHLCADAG
jgi:hypothetical protein